jgi:hypothetical protein
MSLKLAARVRKLNDHANVWLLMKYSLEQAQGAAEA